MKTPKLANIRQSLLNAVARNGGYFKDREGSLIAFLVPFPMRLDISFDTIQSRYLQERGELGSPVTLADPYWVELKSRWDAEEQNFLFYRLQEQLYAELNTNQTHRTAPNGTIFKAKFSLLGRSSKHLCVNEFEGVGLDRTSFKDFTRMLTPGSDNDMFEPKMTISWCRNFLTMVNFWSDYFTSRNAGAELTRLAVHLMSEMAHCEKRDRDEESRFLAAFDPWFSMDQSVA